MYKIKETFEYLVNDPNNFCSVHDALEKSYINYTAIIKINDKYYSFDWYDTEYLDLDEQINVDKDLIEVFPKEVTITRYEKLKNK